MTNINLLTLKVVRHKIEEEFDVKLQSFSDAGVFFKKMIGDNDRETFALVCVDVKGKINNYAVSHVGTLSAALVSPREVFKYAILSNSNAIIIAHNHPSGDLRPSEADFEMTKALVEAGKIMGIRILDHIIVSDKNYMSLRILDEEMFK